MKKIKLNIVDMSCTSCALNNEKALLKTRGIISANVNFATKKAYIEYDDDILNEDNVKKIIIDNGYEIEEETRDKKQETRNKQIEFKNGSHKHGMDGISKDWKNFIGSAILSIPLFVEMVYKIRTEIMILNIDLIMWAHAALATIVVFYFGWRFHKMAFKQVKKLRANMDTLISLGTLAAYFYSLGVILNIAFAKIPVAREGYFESAGLIITLILLGKYFESRSLGQAGEAMQKLMELGVKKARLLVDNREMEIDTDSVKIGDILIIKPSEKIPLDGIIIEGEASINEAMLTGESMPAEKKVGDKVFGATLNLSGLIKIKVSEIGEGTVLAQIIKTVADAQASKAPIEKFADKVSGIFVPAVLIISAATFIGWLLVKDNFTISLINAIAVLVIACPCALGLATPTAIMAGTGKGAKKGILFKSGESFEKAKGITTVIFDKTGTLTKGELSIKKIISNDKSEEEILKIAHSLAQNSLHPISRAISSYGSEKKIDRIKINKIEEVEGMGIMGEEEGNRTKTALGNKKILIKNNIDLSWADKILSLDEVGTWVFISVGAEAIGAILVADEIKENAAKIIAEIKKQGLAVGMISGDHKRTAEAIGKELGIDLVLAEVLPNQKAAEIKKLQEQGKRVIFVGDGINDAPSLVQADLGIAVGNATDIAKEAGQIILLDNNLEKVIEAIKISKLTFKTIKQNLFWAFSYNIIAIPLAVAGFLNPIIAAGAMAFSSVSVVLNSLRIYRKY